jgi:D-tyrosyl-tRNA(Tyr) deacylase
MRAVLQRVTSASVRIDDEVVGEIAAGLVVLLAIGVDDTERDVEYMLEKIVGLRIFDDQSGQMNLSIIDVDAELLVVSQFTLFGDVRRGRRPSYSHAAPPELAERLYQEFVEMAKLRLRKVATGGFRKTMKVELVNDGPVTILLDSRKLF